MADGQDITKPGTAAPYATGVQGVTGGVPVPVRPAPVSGVYSQILSSAGTATIFTPDSGKRVRVRRIAFNSPDTNTATNLITITLGGTQILNWYLSASGGGYSTGTYVTEGPADGVLTVTLTASQTVALNINYEQFP